MSHAIELLAPAGNAAALRAAVRGGADAVYLGLDSFNARRGADNFTLETLADACAYAHLRGVRVYVTFNTAVLPSEVARALETVRQAYRAGADAFIVQDIGIASEISRALPEARLHISTQMNTHNAAGIEAAARLGAQRVTLARELSVLEIAHLAEVADGYGMEVESFAHGALCVCYSGQCFMSSLIGGRSANRGLCAQACRLPYTLHNVALRKNLPAPGEHLLSPQDLCAIDLLPELVEAGVTSFKIEGRMKSPEYVFAVTQTYRAVLDRTLAERAAGSGKDVRAAEDEHRTLAEAFSRGFTTAYLENQRGNDIMSYGRPNNRGVFVGRVTSAKNGVATVAAERPLAPGDVLEFWTNKGHFAYTLDQVSLDKQGNVRMAPDRPVGKGDRVFRVRSAEAAFEDDVFEPRVAVTGRVVLRIGQPLRVEFSLAPSAAERSRGIPCGDSPYPPDRRSRRRCDRARAYEAGDGRRRACACRSPGSNSVSARIARGRTRRGCGYRLLAAAPRARRRARRPCAAAARAHAQPCVAACAGAHGACARAPARRAHRGVGHESCLRTRGEAGRR